MAPSSCSLSLNSGFTQGGAVACTTALTYPEKQAGVIALSTYIPSPALLTEESAGANRPTIPASGHVALSPKG